MTPLYPRTPDIASNMLAIGSNQSRQLTAADLSGYVADMSGMQRAMALRHSIGGSIGAVRAATTMSDHDAALAAQDAEREVRAQIDGAGVLN